MQFAISIHIPDPMLGVYFPAAQSLLNKQDREPEESAKVPATHGVQDDEPYWEEYEPELHIPQTTSTPPGLK